MCRSVYQSKNCSLDSQVGMVRTLSQGILHPTWWVVPLVSYSHSYRWYHSHLHPLSHFLLHNSTIITEYIVKSFLCILPCQGHELTPNAAYTECRTKYSIHWVEACTQQWLWSLHSHNCVMTLECTISFWLASLLDGPPPASPLWELKAKVNLSHSHGCELTN